MAVPTSTAATLACDTLIALPGSAAPALATIYAKNADRPSFEWQPLAVNPRKRQPIGSTVRSVSGLEVPQAPTTAATTGRQ